MSWKLLDQEQTFALFEYFLFEQIVKIRAENVQGSKNWVLKIQYALLLVCGYWRFSDK
jgi:hypothetical protein